MKRGVIAAVALACGLALWFATRDSPPHEPTGPAKPAPKSAKIVPPPAPGPTWPTPVPLPIAAEAAALHSPAHSAEDDLAIVTGLLEEYRRHFAGNPVGDNDEITAALRGGNPKGLACLPVEGGPFLDPAGRLIDRWGTPYFFHALSAREMEIHSAGPDREFHTDDDIRGGL